MGGGFDPNAMAMMYQNMMKSESFAHSIITPVLMSGRHGRDGQCTRYQPEYGVQHDAEQHGWHGRNGRYGDG